MLAECRCASRGAERPERVHDLLYHTGTNANGACAPPETTSNRYGARAGEGKGELEAGGCGPESPTPATEGKQEKRAVRLSMALWLPACAD